MGFGKDGKGVIHRQRDSIVLGGLGTAVAIKQATPPPVTDSFRMLKSEGTASIENATLVEGDGPVEIWLCSDDLSVAEIAAAISVTAGAPTARDDIIGNELALRPVFYLGALEFVPIGVGGKTIFEWSKTIRWTFGDGTSWALVAFNLGSTLTTGGTVRFHHTAYGVWVGA
jgi:hypothetical protein